MQELICNIQFDRDGDTFIAKLRTEIGGLREFSDSSFDSVLNQVMLELEEEFL